MPKYKNISVETFILTIILTGLSLYFVFSRMQMLNKILLGNMSPVEAERTEFIMKKNTSIIIGMAIGASVGCAISIFSNILALPICMSMGISVGLIFSAKENNERK